jgi:hypothetical protein
MAMRSYGSTWCPQTGMTAHEGYRPPLARAEIGLGCTAPLFLIKPSMDTLDVAASYATVAGSVHRHERILTIYTPHAVAKPFGAIVECVFFFCHQSPTHCLSRKSATGHGHTITGGEAPMCFRSQKYALRSSSWASKASAHPSARGSMAAGSGDRSLPCVRPGNKFGPLRLGFTLSSHNFRPHVEAVHDVAG